MEYETIRRLGGASSPKVAEFREPGWWPFYRELLGRGTLTETALKVLNADAEYLVTFGVLGAGAPLAAGSLWPATRLRRGLAMGSVQSGKTASLLGVAAKSLDRGVNIVVILAGTRVALWRQTYERTVAQLDGWSAESDSERRTHRMFLPAPSRVMTSEGLPDLDSLYFETPNLARRVLLQGRPLVAVVMKHADHLMRFGNYLHKVLDATLARSPNPLHMLVIDDEADDGSILDKEVEAGLAPDAEGLKQIPRHIARLWSGHRPHFETLADKLFATYLGYTATPQSNFLQSDHNPLSPTEFIAALRVPYERGSIERPRSTTFEEPTGVRRYYTGGELFYRRLADGPGALCIAKKFPDKTDLLAGEEFEAEVARARDGLLSDALRCYFVGGAIRLFTTKRRLTSARGASPALEQYIRRLIPDPHCMLYHPSARIGEQFDAARQVADWGTQYENSTADRISADVVPQLSASGLVFRLSKEEPLWKEWLRRFRESSERLSFFPGGHIYPKIEEDRWPEIRALLVEEIFPHTRLAIINSDPRADDRPRFDPQAVASDRFIAPTDIYTIFVSGNVMARGITIEGLATTLFLRTANEPLADTQMQMQRWFGYRGNHLSYCRIFMFEDQLDLFRAYHEGDEALRLEIVDEMNKDSAKAPSPLVLQGERYKATGKVANLRALPLCPGPDPFVRLIESGLHAATNAKVLTDLLKAEKWEPVVAAGRPRGIAMTRRLSLLEVASLLEAFRYSIHNPDPSAPQHDRWRAIGAEIGLRSPDAPLFRPPLEGSKFFEAVDPPSCPYSIAAYLRFWSALLTRRARGIYPTDDPKKPWSMIDLQAYRASSPAFYVGIRFGAAGVSAHHELASFGVLRMDRNYADGVLKSTWGSRNPGESEGSYLGDQLFDYHVHERTPPRQSAGEPLWRPRGEPGLVLFHVIRTLEGQDAVNVGLALPAGGPDHIAALRSKTH